MMEIVDLVIEAAHAQFKLEMARLHLAYSKVRKQWVIFRITWRNRLLIHLYEADDLFSTIFRIWKLPNSWRIAPILSIRYRRIMTIMKPSEGWLKRNPFTLAQQLRWQDDGMVNLKIPVYVKPKHKLGVKTEWESEKVD